MSEEFGPVDLTGVKPDKLPRKKTKEKKLCKTCRNWQGKKGMFSYGFGSCVSNNMFGNNRHKIQKHYPGNSLVTWGIENQESGFTTGSRFGCVNWLSHAWAQEELKGE